MLPDEQFISLIAMDLHDQIKSLSSNDEFIKGIIKCLKERSTPPLQTALSDWTLNDGDAHSGALDNKPPKNHKSARAHLQ